MLELAMMRTTPSLSATREGSDLVGGSIGGELREEFDGLASLLASDPKGGVVAEIPAGGHGAARCCYARVRARQRSFANKFPD